MMVAWIQVLRLIRTWCAVLDVYDATNMLGTLAKQLMFDPLSEVQFDIAFT